MHAFLLSSPWHAQCTSHGHTIHRHVSTCSGHTLVSRAPTVELSVVKQSRSAPTVWRYHQVEEVFLINTSDTNSTMGEENTDHNRGEKVGATLISCSSSKAITISHFTKLVDQTLSRTFNVHSIPETGTYRKLCAFSLYLALGKSLW